MIISSNRGCRQNQCLKPLMPLHFYEYLVKLFVLFAPRKGYYRFQLKTKVAGLFNGEQESNVSKV